MTLLKVNNRPAAKPFDGLMNDLFGNFEHFFSPNSAQNVPPVNISETTDGYHLELVAAGRTKENFKLKVENGLLSISYEEPTTESTTENKQIRKEFTTGNFKRNFTLDEKVNADAITARYEDGLLKLFVPKKEEAKPLVKEITIG